MVLHELHRIFPAKIVALVMDYQGVRDETAESNLFHFQALVPSGMRLLTTLYEGSNSVVFLGSSSDAFVVIKCPKTDVALVQLYREEAVLRDKLCGLPYVPRVLAFGTGDTRCLVTSYMGCDLATAFASLPHETRLQTLSTWTRPLVAVVAELHLRGVIHHDLCPANLVLRSNGQFAVIDFGCAFVPAMHTFAIDGSKQYAPKNRRLNRHFAYDWVSLAFTLHALAFGVDKFEQQTRRSRPAVESLREYADVWRAVSKTACAPELAMLPTPD